jgi:hypothetical protein
LSPQHLASELFAGCYTVGTWYNDARSKKRWIILRPDLVGSLRDPTELITLQPLSLPVSGQLVQRKCNLVSRQSSTVNFGDFDQPWRVNRMRRTLPQQPAYCVGECQTARLRHLGSYVLAAALDLMRVKLVERTSNQKVVR